MNILVTGATGLIGTALSRHLSEQGHTLYSMSRDNPQSPFYWQDLGNHHWQIQWDETITIDAVIHLAGESIGSTRWSAAKKQRIVDSRIDTTTALVKKLAELSHPPKVLISASAIGFYGDCGNKVVDEYAPNGNDFLASLAKRWEAAAQQASELGIRVVNLRTGLVLDKNAGALASMLAAFKMGAGGKIGHGKQMMSWVSIEEIPKMISFLLHHDTISGAVNLVSPNAVSNAEFTRTLGRVLSRPTLIPMPKIMVKTIFGEMGELLLLSSIDVAPKRLQSAGYVFDDLSLAETLQSLIKSTA